jgi:hypothetical protein
MQLALVKRKLCNWPLLNHTYPTIDQQLRGYALIVALTEESAFGLVIKDNALCVGGHWSETQMGVLYILYEI